VKFKLGLMALFLVILCGCTGYENSVDKIEKEVKVLDENIEKDNRTIGELLGRIERLEESNKELENMVFKQEKEQEYLIKTYYLVEQFIKAYLDKDINSMTSLVSDDVSIIL
jgi:prefoldin subunit 5